MNKEPFCQLGRGAAYAFAGIGEFYRNPRYWRYAALPLALLLAVYAAGGWYYWVRIMPHAAGWIGEAEGAWRWLEVVLAPLRWLLQLTVLLFYLMFAAKTVNAFFEIFWALFFSRLVIRFERERYDLGAARLPWRREWLWNLECGIFAAVTFVLWLALFAVGWFLPVIGPLLPIIAVGYRYGLSYLFNSGFNRNMSIAMLRGELAGHRGLVRGFGAVIYLIMLAPVVAVFFIPGLVLGGSMLLNEGVYRVPPRRENLNSPRLP